MRRFDPVLPMIALGLVGVPLVWRVRTFDDGIQSMQLEPVRYLLADRTRVSADCTVDWRIKAIDPFFRNVGQTARAQAWMSAVVHKGLREWTGSRHVLDAAELESYLKSKLRPPVEQSGIKVISVRVGEIAAENAWRKSPDPGWPGLIR